jgi:nicotinate-nucleotide pyrophosphorylase
VIDPILIEELIGPFLREDIGFVDLTSTIMIDATTARLTSTPARTSS